MLLRVNFMIFYKSVWMFSDVVFVMKQIYISIGEVWFRKYLKLVYMSEIRRIEVFVVCLEGEK